MDVPRRWWKEPPEVAGETQGHRCGVARPAGSDPLRSRSYRRAHGPRRSRQDRAVLGPGAEAFERHAWLFGDESRRALERARQLEGELHAAGVPVLYPLEGYASQPVGDAGPELLVLSPPSRLIRTLLVADDVVWLVAEHPTPLGWLFQAEDLPDELPIAQVMLDQELSNRVLTPENIPRALAQPAGSQASPDTLAKDWAAKAELEPEYFGDSLFNNTSLVLWLRVVTGVQSHRVLLTGDQENWTYLLGCHPMGLQADVLKAVHHGGRMYLESAEAAHEVLSTVRPRAVLISACGEHGLPRSATRRAAITWGASVFCTSRRTREFVTGSGDVRAGLLLPRRLRLREGDPRRHVDPRRSRDPGRDHRLPQRPAR